MIYARMNLSFSVRNPYARANFVFSEKNKNIVYNIGDVLKTIRKKVKFPLASVDFFNTVVIEMASPFRFCESVYKGASYQSKEILKKI